MTAFRTTPSLVIIAVVTLLAISNTAAQVINRAVLDTTGDGLTDLHLSTRALDGGTEKLFWCSRSITNQTPQLGCVEFGIGPTQGILLGADFENDADTEMVFWGLATQVFLGGPGFAAMGSPPFQQTPFRFGSDDDPTVTADYTGDGKADFAVFRCRSLNAGEQCYWIYRSSATGQDIWVAWGTVTFPGRPDIAAPGDYDGDGKSDFAVRRFQNPSDPNSQQVFYILRSSDGGVEYRYFGLGQDKFVKGDFDGDGKADLCAARNTGVDGARIYWFIRYSNGGEVSFLPWGRGRNAVSLIGDHLASGDYNGDGRTDIAVWRHPVTNVESYFYILPSSPVPGAFGPPRYEQVGPCSPRDCENAVAEYLVH